MKRVIFFILLVGSIIGSTMVVLFVPQFFSINGAEFGNGIDWLFNGFFPQLFAGEHEFAFNSTNGLMYAMSLFLILNAITLISLTLVLLINGLKLGRSSRLYRNCAWFFMASAILTGFYIWFVIDIMTLAETAWSINTLSWAFYIPIGTALVATILGGVLRASEVND